MMAHMEGCPYPISDLAEISRVSRGRRFGGLVVRIRDYGVRPPVTVWRGEVIHGLEFLLAYVEAGVEPEYDHVPEDRDLFDILAERVIPSQEMDDNERGVSAYLLSQWSTRGRPSERDEKCANLRIIHQKDAAALYGVKLRLVSYASQVLSDDSTAVPTLRQAVREYRIKASDAANVVSRPREVQEKAMALVVSKKLRTVRRAVEQVEREIAEAEDSAALEEMLGLPLDEAVDLRVATPADLLRALPANSIDAIITNPPQLVNQMHTYSDLADLAVHVLKPDGLMAVVGSSMLLQQQLRHLEHEGLRWIMQVNLHMGGPPIDSGSPHHVNLHQRPLLIYGKSGFRPPAGWSDLIEVPQPEDNPSGLDRNELMMCRIVERLCRPGGALCDPIMLDRAGAALAARGQGCPFIGATEHQSSLGRIWGRVGEVGLPEAPDGDGAPETEAIPG